MYLKRIRSGKRRQAMKPVMTGMRMILSGQLLVLGDEELGNGITCRTTRQYSLVPFRYSHARHLPGEGLKFCR